MPNELIIPPDITPESPEQVELVDDQTFTFRPQFGRNWMQRNSYGDPRWRFTRRYRGLRQKDRARIQAVLGEAQGGYRTIMVSPAQNPSGTWLAAAGGEVLTGADLSSTAGWAAGSEASIASLNNALRVKRTSNIGIGGGAYVGQSVSGLTPYAPYIWRFVVNAARGTNNVQATYGGNALDFSSPFGTAGGLGYFGRGIYSTTSAGTVYADNNGNSVSLAGEYYELSFTSLARCFAVDGGPNLLVRSEEFDNAAWTKTRASISANSITAPDSTATADTLIEDGTAASSHYTQQTITTSSAVGDYCFSAIMAAGTRLYAQLILQENTAGSIAYVDVNFVNGTLGTASISGANWSNPRAYISNLGNGWFQVSIVARKTNAATSLTGIIVMCSAFGTSSYNGDGTSRIYLWRSGLAQSSFPVRLRQTTNAAATAETQSGPRIYVKGLPVSQAGLLVAGDWIELDGQLKQLTASLDSDAAGLGCLQVRPKVARAVADNTPVIVTKPMGRFMLGENARWDAMFGLNIDAPIVLDEVYE